MEEILIFAGTTEGRRLSESLSEAGVYHTVCVATEYGELVLKEDPFLKVHQGRMDQEQIKGLLQKGSFAAVVDATHPYADVVTKNIKAAMEGMQLPYLRLQRESAVLEKEENISYFEDHEACAKALENIPGNILLTTGSKELRKYCASEEIKNRLFVRILPAVESLLLCMEEGIKGRQLIAMQGPFTIQMNEAMLQQYEISCLVTKQSGAAGGYFEKVEAARKAKIPVFVVGMPAEEAGYSFREVCKRLETICQKEIPIKNELEITLAGIGMGNEKTMTGEVLRKIEEADVLLGAERMVKPYSPRIEKKPFYLAEQIVPYLKELPKRYPAKSLKVVILFSGDSGFYSGCQHLYQALQEEKREGALQADIRILPGISSVAFLAARIGESYQDAAIYSMHGKKLDHLAYRLRAEKKAFLLTSGVKDVNRLGEILLKAGMTECEVITGYQLSYAEEKIEKRTPKECAELWEEGLYTCFVKNKKAEPQSLTHGIPDTAFIRDKVPMTKEEIREVSICKLRLYQGAVIYDIGSGTGSVAVEIAGLSSSLQVYAIEQKKEAVSLLRQNKEKFQLENIEVVEAKAPEGLLALPKASHAFIGGSGGRLKEILQTLYAVNPNMRVVLSAISMETICELKEILTLYPMEQEEIVQLQVSRMKEAGSYHLMQAENPIWLCAFWFREK